jgi:hypothetical protein
MYFAEESIKKLAADYALLSEKRDNLREAYLTRTYEVPRAKEFADHGVSRRLRMMVHCIEQVFTILPPERTENPSMEELIDAVVHIQAFIFNAFACLDNFAWIWVCEKKLTQDDGTPILDTWVGIGKKNRIVRASLPADFRTYLKSVDAWLQHLESFRHALAHRIPLYIPPRVVSKQDARTYELLGKRKTKAIKCGLFNRAAALAAAQDALVRFEPVMMHSREDKSKRIVLHPQLLSDIEIVAQIGWKMHAALDSVPEKTVVSRVRGSLGIALSRLWMAIVRKFGRSA